MTSKRRRHKIGLRKTLRAAFHGDSTGDLLLTVIPCLGLTAWWLLVGVPDDVYRDVNGLAGVGGDDVRPTD